MGNTVRAIPEGFHTVTPSLVIRGAAKAIDFYKRAFGAKVTVRMDMPDGRIGHAELLIGDSHIFLGDEWPEMGAKSPEEFGGSPVSLFLYVENADTFFKTAVDAGAKVLMPLENMFWGDRYGKVTDPFGHTWQIATHMEDVTPEEMKKRQAAMFKQAGGGA